MSLFHRHDWRIVRSTYIPPKRDFKASNVSEPLLQQFTFGLTTTTLRCSECGAITSHQTTGDARMEVEA